MPAQQSRDDNAVAHVRRLESSLPEAFSAFTKQEQDTFRFHESRAAKSELSARLVKSYYLPETRTQRLVRFIQNNPQSGLPNFWQWDKSLNPEPFRRVNG